jgi:hypothetical protein
VRRLHHHRRRQQHHRLLHRHQQDLELKHEPPSLISVKSPLLRQELLKERVSQEQSQKNEEAGTGRIIGTSDLEQYLTLPGHQQRSIFH